MTPAECRPGMLVRLCSAPSRTWEVMAVDGGWAELLHRESGARVQLTISSLYSDDEPRRAPTWVCWFAAAMALAFVAIHVWAAVEVGRSASGLDPLGGAVAIASGGVGWAAWFVTMMWVQWRRR
jgi:hypothetical protein